MKSTALLASMASLALLFGCGGMVVVERDGGRGGDGAGGSSNDGGGAQGGAASCDDVDCTSNGASCSCETQCMGPVLRADCAMTDDSTVICECHYDGGYMGTCGEVAGSACSLPNGCCTDYL